MSRMDVISVYRMSVILCQNIAFIDFVYGAICINVTSFLISRRVISVSETKEQKSKNIRPQGKANHVIICMRQSMC